MKNQVKDALFGVAVGDALGVPVEFKDRSVLKANPVTDMQGFGTHNQPLGTWSDDSSLAFCLAESLCKGYDLQDMANSFVKWYERGHWTPHGKVFDIGITTAEALWRLSQGASPTLGGSTDEKSNGNGSLMRILPLAFYVKNIPLTQRFTCVKEVSSLTHAHIRSVLSCFIYLEVALELMKGQEKTAAFQQAGNTVRHFLETQPITSDAEIARFHRLLPVPDPVLGYESKPIYDYPEADIESSGYVLHSLEAALWCLLNSHSYQETVLKAVNLGSDTNTTAAIAGGLAGLYYGVEQIPEKWVEALARKEDIDALAERLNKKYS